ncbi:MAG TPA: metallophosphoesterase [Acidimicrobiia bacterium]|nr:metallophosphoesterase [Acidimicrobiia bacterium]
MIWFTADTHFGHAAIMRYSERPFVDVDAMDEYLIATWNEHIKPTDTVWHLGDFSLRAPDPYWARLNGHKNIIFGNHDDPKKLTRLAVAGGGVAKEVHNLRNGRQRIFLSHYAHRTWPASHYGTLHLFGHSHGALSRWGRSMDVGVDAIGGYRPISLDEVIEELRFVAPMDDVGRMVP